MAAMEADREQDQGEPRAPEGSCVQRFGALLEVKYLTYLVTLPWLVYLMIFVVTAAMAGSVFGLGHFPDLEKPLKGFVSTHTEITGEENAVNNLQNTNTGLQDTPDVSLLVKDFNFTYQNCLPGRKRRELETQETVLLEDEEVQEGQARSRRSLWGCPFPDTSYSSSMIYTATDGNTLWRASTLRAMCSVMESRFSMLFDGMGCFGTWYFSVGDYVAQIANTNCSLLTQADLATAEPIIINCLAGYYNGSLNVNTSQYMSQQCQDAFTIKYHLADKNFLPAANPRDFSLTYARVYIYYSHLLQLDQFYRDNILGKKLEYGEVTLAAVDFSDIKYSLIEEYMIRDSVWFGLAMLVILVIMGIYTRSFLLPFVTLLMVVVAFAITYAAYFLIYGIKHFPFLNLTGIIVLIGIAADDVFVMVDMWELSAKLADPGGKAKVHDGVNPCTGCCRTNPGTQPAEIRDLRFMFRHGLLSVLVTSLTTSAAFFVNVFSEVVDVKCFGIYAGTLVLVNFLITASVTPVTVVYLRRFSDFCCSCSCNDCAFRKAYQSISKVSAKFFGSSLPWFLSKTYHVITILGLGLTVGASVVVFYKPGLQLPSSSEIQVFQLSDPIEQYDQVVKFKMEEQKSGYNFNLQYVWGVDKKDTASQFNPDDKGTFRLDGSFDMYTPDTQVFLRDFCRVLKKERYVSEEDKQQACLFDLIEQSLSLPCTCATWQSGGFGIPVRTEPCCNMGLMPYPKDNFTFCLPFAYSLALRNISLAPFLGQMKFDGYMAKVLHYEVSTNFTFTLAHEPMDGHYKEVESFFKDQTAAAPSELRSGFVAGEFYFYDLQNSLLKSTYQAIYICLAAATVMMFITTWNILITLYSIIAIYGSIITTIAVMVLLKWQLNILESIAITLAIGLSIDFTIHLGVAYVNAEDKSTRLARVKDANSKVGAAVTMAALTTFLAGASACGATIYNYWQFGIFLMLVMTFSFIFAIFFFNALCVFAGPTNHFAQISYYIKKCCCGGKVRQDSDIQLRSHTKTYADEFSPVHTEKDRSSPENSRMLTGTEKQSLNTSQNGTGTCTPASANGLDVGNPPDDAIPAAETPESPTNGQYTYNSWQPANKGSQMTPEDLTRDP